MILPHEFHEYAGIFPLMVETARGDDGELFLLRADENEPWRDFVMDIRVNGLQEPITLYEGQVLDGRNRLVACIVSGVKPKYREYEGDDPLAYVLSGNLHRRHLSTSQRAVLALEILPYYEADAREKRRARAKAAHKGERGFSESEDPPLTPEEKQAGRSDDRAGKAVGVSAPTVQRMKRIEREAPEEIERIKRGETTVGGVVAELKRREREAEREAREAEAAAGRTAAQQEIVNKPLREAASLLTSAGRKLAEAAEHCTRFEWDSLDLTTRESLAKALDSVNQSIDNLPWGDK